MSECHWILKDGNTLASLSARDRQQSVIYCNWTENQLHAQERELRVECQPMKRNCSRRRRCDVTRRSRDGKTSLRMYECTMRSDDPKLWSPLIYYALVSCQFWSAPNIHSMCPYAPISSTLLIIPPSSLRHVDQLSNLCNPINASPVRKTRCARLHRCSTVAR